MSSGIPIPKEKDKKKKKLPSLKTLRNKADGYLTPIMKKKSPMCEGCKISRTQVAHHWVEKGRCSRLRYEISNLVALCNSCHTKIHNRFGNSVLGSVDIAEKIIEQRGDDWRAEMVKLSTESVKVNREYYTKNIDLLSTLYENL